MINIAFLNRLASSRSDAEFARTATGLAALQVYDSIKTNGFDPFVHQDALQRVSLEIEGMEGETSLRTALESVVQALPFWDTDGRVRVGRRAVYTSLLVYGQVLGDEGAWEIAESIYSLVGTDSELDGETWLAAEARLLMGRASRMCADWDASRIAYRRAYELGMEAGDISLALRSRIGEANNLWSRGDFPAAMRLLDITARRARASCPPVLPRVILALAGVANAAGEYERAIHLAYGLLESISDDDDLRYQTLVDLAIFLTDYGLPPVAAAALRIVERAAPEPRVRRQAKLNLFFLAAQDDDEAAFNTLRAELDAEPFSAREKTQYALFAARGLRQFKKFDEAQASVERAIQLADQCQLFQLLFEAEAELQTIERTRADMYAAAAAAPGPSGHSPAPTKTMGRRATSARRYRSTTGSRLPPRMRRVAESLETMAAEQLRAAALQSSSAL
jgi:tetratricopeptide (TPR) repeat protein